MSEKGEGEGEEEKNHLIDKVINQDEIKETKKRFWIIILLLITTIIIGLPSWYFTTLVERSKLPIESMQELINKYSDNLEFQKYEIPIQIIEIPDPLIGLIDETQLIINEKLNNINSKIGIKLFKNDEFESYYKLKLIMNEDSDSLIVSPYKDRLIKLFISPNIIKNGLVSDLISRILIDNIFKYEILGELNNNDTNNNNNNGNSKIIKFPFSNDYKISINFLHSNNKYLGISRETLKNVIENFKNFINILKPIANFSIEFQELWYERRLITEGEYKIDNITYIKDPRMFIDYSDWGLDQDVELEPIINLNLYMTDEEEKIIIENSIKNSFIIPQWGGVVIHNEDENIEYDQLNEIFDIFAYQVLKLIGIESDINKSLYYRIDEIIRIQTIKNINNSLNNFKSLIKLINQLDTIPIPLQTVKEIEESINYIRESIYKLNSLDWIQAYEKSTNALVLSNNAFFHKDMVQQAYFPEEHKMAVYSPLLGPFATIMVMALVRGYKEQKVSYSGEKIESFNLSFTDSNKSNAAKSEETDVSNELIKNKNKNKINSNSLNDEEFDNSILPGMDPYFGKELLIKQYQRANATIMTLCQENDLDGIVETIRKLEDRFNNKYHYDWVFLNNIEFSNEFKSKVSKFVSGNARFGIIPKEHWSYPSFIDLEKAKTERQRMEDDGVIYAGSESYRHMCRFNSGFFYKHPIMEEYKYYWRVEPHVEFTCDINYDPFKYMVDNDKIYGFTITIHEFERTIESLWDTTKRFLSQHSDYLDPHNLIKFISNDDGETYNLCHFWSNFEIADMDFWRSKEYEDYFQYLDKSGGFFYERWGDAPVHSIAASLFLNRNKLHFFKDIGYIHGVYQMCPIEDEIYESNKCFCDKNNDFTFDGYACGKEFFDSMGWKKPGNWEQYAD
ncbi:hypothetical protein C6P42_001605 [Pichia californica]|nr:hypothetical protein C6P42_001605 [[Candida] californica]